MNKDEQQFEDIGCWCTPAKKGDPVYDIQAIDQFCKENGLESKELTDDVLARFVIGEY